MNEDSPIVPLVAGNVLDHIEKRLQDSNIKEFTDEELLSLHSIYGDVFYRALNVLDKYSKLEVYYTTNKSRTLIEIKGENNQYYRVFPKINFCSCQAFKHQVLEKKTQITCKHVLAGRISCMLDRTVGREVSVEQYLILIKSMFELE